MTSATKRKSHEFLEFIAQATQLRENAAAAESDYLAFLMEKEAEETLWGGNGYAAFDEIVSAYNLCETTRFAEFKKAANRFGIGTVRTIGVDAAVLFLRIPDGTKSDIMPSYLAWKCAIQDAKDDRVKTGQVISEREAKVIVRRHYKATPRPRTASAEVEKLRAQNAKLRKENADLRAENANLREENLLLKIKIEDLEAIVARLTTPPTRPRSRTASDSASGPL